MSSPTTTPVWFITGASSGFGQAVAKEALGRGHRVVACARSTASLADLAAAGATVMAVDVTATDDELAAKLAEAAGVHGTITHVLSKKTSTMSPSLPSSPAHCDTGRC